MIWDHEAVGSRPATWTIKNNKNKKGDYGMFDDNGDFVLKVKFQDTYKALANYINNGLGIKRDDVERYLEDFARKIIHEYDFYPVIKAVMNEKLTEVFREKYS